MYQSFNKFEGKPVVLKEPTAEEVGLYPPEGRYLSAAEVDEETGFDPESETSVEKEIVLDSIEAVNRFELTVLKDILDKIKEIGLDKEAFEQTLVYQKKQEFSRQIERLRAAFDRGEDSSDLQTQEIQEAYEAVLDAQDDLETAPFASPVVIEQPPEFEIELDSYTKEHVDSIPDITDADKLTLNMLLRERNRLEMVGRTEDAEEVVMDIRSIVQKYEDAEAVAIEGEGADLTLDKKGVELKPEKLDIEDQKVEVHASKTRLENLIAWHGEEVGRDLYESEIVRANLRAEIKKDRAKSEQVTKVEPEASEPVEKVEVVSEVSKDNELSPEEQLQAALIEAGAETLEPELADEAMNDLPTQLSSEEQLKKDLEAFGVDSLEPGISEEVYGKSQVQVQESKEADVSSPIATKDTVSVSTEISREQKEYKKKKHNEIKAIEGFDSGGFISRLLNEGQSPYEKLADENFEDLVLNSQSPFVDSFKRSKFLEELKRQNIDQQAFENWMKLAPEIQEMGIETNGKTFKEVADEFAAARIQERNTQSA